MPEKKHVHSWIGDYTRTKFANHSRYIGLICMKCKKKLSNNFTEDLINDLAEIKSSAKIFDKYIKMTRQE